MPAPLGLGPKLALFHLILYFFPFYVHDELALEVFRRRKAEIKNEERAEKKSVKKTINNHEFS
jgi:hypothetical protein